MRISAETERQFLEAVFKAQRFSAKDGALLADTRRSMQIYVQSRHMVSSGWLGIRG